MNRKSIIWIAVAVVVAIIVALFFFLGRGNDVPSVDYIPTTIDGVEYPEAAQLIDSIPMVKGEYFDSEKEFLTLEEIEKLDYIVKYENDKLVISSIKDVGGETPHEHKYVANVVAPTVEAGGYTEYTCECGDSYKDNFTDKLDPSHEHKFTTQVVEPTVDAQGYTEYTCECGYSYKDNFTDKLDAPHEHKYVETVVAPTVDDQGYTEYTCECGHSYKDNYTDKLTPPHEHKFAVDEKVDATVDKEGYIIYKCECGETKRETLPKLPEPHTHKYTSKVVKPTTEAQGYTEYTCECGHSYKDNFTDKIHVHKYTDKVVAPTTTSEGYTLHTCECGHSYRDNYVDKIHEHKYTSKVIAPTTTERGYTLHTCSCGHSYKDNYTDKLPEVHTHKYTSKVVAPTTTSEGYTEHTCECGHSYRDSYVPKLPEVHTHKYTSRVVEPTIYAQGYTEYTCSCGHSYRDNYKDKLPQPGPGEWTNTGGDNDGTWHGQSGQNAGQLPSGEFIEDNYYKRPAPLTEGGNWDDFKNYIYETYGLFFFNNGIGKNIGGMQGTGMNSTAILNTEGRVSIKVFEWRKSYASDVATNKILNVVLETMWFACGDRDVAFALWSWMDAVSINGNANSNDFGFRDVRSTPNGGVIEMNGIQIEVDLSVSRETLFIFN